MVVDGWKKIVKLLCESPVKRDLVELFIAKKEILIPLLENICQVHIQQSRYFFHQTSTYLKHDFSSQEFQSNDGPLMNLLLEAYLLQWSGNKEESEENQPLNEKILALLSKAPNCPTWDWARALFACKKVCFPKHF